VPELLGAGKAHLRSDGLRGQDPKATPAGKGRKPPTPTPTTGRMSV